MSSPFIHGCLNRNRLAQLFNTWIASRLRRFREIDAESMALAAVLSVGVVRLNAVILVAKPVEILIVGDSSLAVTCLFLEEGHWVLTERELVQRLGYNRRDLRLCRL